MLVDKKYFLCYDIFILKKGSEDMERVTDLQYDYSNVCENCCTRDNCFYPDGKDNDICLYLLALKRLQEYENVMFNNEGDEVISLTDLILLREIIGRE